VFFERVVVCDFRVIFGVRLVERKETVIESCLFFSRERETISMERMFLPEFPPGVCTNHSGLKLSPGPQHGVPLLFFTQGKYCTVCNPGILVCGFAKLQKITMNPYTTLKASSLYSCINLKFLSS
jgi:hypothetical protein